MKENKSLFFMLILLILALIFSLARIIKPFVFDEIYYTTYAYTFEDGSTIYMSAKNPSLQSRMEKIFGTVSRSKNTTGPGSDTGNYSEKEGLTEFVSDY